ncbi:KIF-binding protein [Chrysoperla carnea]|uniref:KIF-binding protein n=1 Tax=Chrysoperla carnea TaxID=189513 RepID=UPI001D05DE72|nr:KIF-binding protein [Chrysoperla carnea]
MNAIDTDLFEELHVKYENLKSLCKECFFQSNDKQSTDADNTDNDINNCGQVNKIQMSELDDNFKVVLKTIEDVIQEITPEHPQYIRLIAMNASVLFEQAKTLVSDDKEAMAKDLLNKAIRLLSNYARNTTISFLYLRILNHYACLLWKREEFEKVSALLENAENIYNDIKSSSVKVFNSDDIFVPDEITNLQDDRENKLEKLVTNNFQMLSWAYNRLNVHDKFTKYQHLVLQRLLEMRDDNALMWATKTGRLATYYIDKNNFQQARYYLAAATLVLEEYEGDLKKIQMNDAVMIKWQEFHQHYAEIGKCWTKYGICLFNESKNQMAKVLYGDNNKPLVNLWNIPFSFVQKHSKPEYIETKNEDNPTRSEFKSEKEGGDVQETKDPLFKFPSLQVSEIENQVTCKFVQKTDEARALFMFTHTWLKRSKSHYTIKEHPLEYINGIFDLSELYRFVALFESDIESQYSVQKRRADALESLSSVLREYRPQCYIPVSIELFRELAEVQMEMMGLNLRRLSAIQDNSLRADATTNRECMLHKMRAMADMHARLDQFSELSMCEVHGSDMFGARDDFDDSTSSSKIIPSDCEITIDVDDDEEESDEATEEGSTDSDNVVVTCIKEQEATSLRELAETSV